MIPKRRSRWLSTNGARGWRRRRDQIRAAWHSDLRSHIIANQAKQRGVAIRKVLDGALPRAPEQQRRIASALIRYQLSATTWHYYRFIFRLTLDDSIEAAETVVRQQLDGKT